MVQSAELVLAVYKLDSPSNPWTCVRPRHLLKDDRARSSVPSSRRVSIFASRIPTNGIHVHRPAPGSPTRRFDGPLSDAIGLQGTNGPDDEQCWWWWRGSIQMLIAGGIRVPGNRDVNIVGAALLGSMCLAWCFVPGTIISVRSERCLV
ncbi:hypothetical protein CCHR01_02306 [Colletotrichum chrysophilum]|uniref:Uncharacterized protein n=1 Tax=Colletotrichum chrysophilum TaxID=1836956 RepID=A0AAD9AUW8_9PEZI|nr:hypothetical protein CCHR01_02306 [Colletotrichum chrysophilum]